MRLAGRALALSLAILLSMLSGTAAALPPLADINSAGPLTHVYLGNELSCQVTRGASKQLYPPNSTLGDCGTFAAYGGTLYKPDFQAHNGAPNETGMNGSGVVLTPVSQSAVTGAGTTGSPYTVVTVVTAGPSLELTQTDTYVAGDEHFLSSIQVKNLDSAPLTASIYRGMDCFLGGADNGYGYQDVASGGTGCSTNINNSPPGNVEALLPTPGQGALRFEEQWDNMWTAIRTRSLLNGSCRCAELLDNGVALQWPLSLAANETQTLTFMTLFSPTGTVPPPPPGPAPSNTSPPTLSGPMHEDQSVTANVGTWNDAGAYTYQYQRCATTAPDSCVDIAGANSSDGYAPTAADGGQYLRVAVTSTNGSGSATAYSALGTAVVPNPPTVVTPPAAPSGPGGAEPVQGQELTADAGAFAGLEGTRTYQFQRCASEDTESCTDIAGATGASYRPTAADVGSRLRLVVTASNAGGSTTAVSPMTSVVHAAPATGTPAPVAPCVSTRSMRLHWTVPARSRMRSFKVTVNGRRVATLRGGTRAVTVSLSGRPVQTVRVRVSGRTASGRTLETVRTYHTCTANLPRTLKTLRLARAK